MGGLIPYIEQIINKESFDLKKSIATKMLKVEAHAKAGVSWAWARAEARIM